MVAENILDLSALDKLSEKEREYALKVLEDLANSNGNSKLYDELRYADYNEIPVDIETFLTDDHYLGQAWKDATGKLKLYDFWMERLKELFPTNIDTAYNTLLESGARGIGKSEIACGCVGAYLMYRVMCLKDPLEYFHLKQTEKICCAFMNIKLALAKEIAISKFQKTIQMSPWFMARGKMTSYHNKPYWNPPNPIQIIIGSQSDDVIGQPIYYCLDGDTVILTDKGDCKLSDLVNEDIKVVSVSDSGELVWSDYCTVKPTAVEQTEYIIELEDGTELHCTPEHRFMLKDGSYKEAQHLTEDDELFDVSRYGYIYKTVNNKTGKIYIGQHHSSTFDNTYLGSGLLLQRAIKKYGTESFSVELLEWCVSKTHLDEREKYHISKYCSIDNTIGYNIANGGQGGNLGPEVCKRIKDALTGRPCSEEKKKLLSEKNKGKKHPSSGSKISAKLTGLKRTDEQKENYRQGALKRDRSIFVTSNKGKVAVTNGAVTKFIDSTDYLPEGFTRGNCNTKGPHNMSRYYQDSAAQERKSESAKGANNSMFRHGERVAGGNNGKATIRYFYKNKTFECRKELIQFIKSEGEYIPESVISAFVQGTVSQKQLEKYEDILHGIQWRNKNENTLNP